MAYTLQAQVNCTPNNITLSSQTAVDEFVMNYGTCDNIVGDLVIGIRVFGLGITSDITNLNGLQNLTSIGGHLYISGNPQLTNIAGLQNLTSIGETLVILQHSQLTNIDGLQNLSSIGGGLTIQSNAKLMEFCGLKLLLSSPNNGVTSMNIGGNASNPTESDIINGDACSRVLPPPVVEEEEETEELPVFPKLGLIVFGIIIFGLGVIRVYRLG